MAASSADSLVNARCGRGCRDPAGSSGNARRSTLAAHEVALGDEVVIGVDDHAARPPKLVRERAAGRQGGARIPATT